MNSFPCKSLLNVLSWFFSHSKEYSIPGLYAFRKSCQRNTESFDGPQSKTASVGKISHWLKHWKKSRTYSVWWQVKCKKYFRIRRCCKQYSFHNTKKNTPASSSHTHIRFYLFSSHLASTKNRSSLTNFAFWKCTNTKAIQLQGSQIYNNDIKSKNYILAFHTGELIANFSFTMHIFLASFYEWLCVENISVCI